MTKEGIDILLTVDKNLQYQQNLAKYPICVVVLLTRDNRYKTLVPYVARIEKEIIAADHNTKILIIDLKK